MSEEITANRRRAMLLVGAEAAVAALVLGIVLFFVLSWVGFVLAVVVVAVAAVVLTRQAPAMVRKRVGGAPADPDRHARLHNLVEGLCPAAGLPKPQLIVVDDAAPNALAYGRHPRDAVVVVTQGLLEKLTRIELEGVLAHELSHIKNLDILPGTIAAVFAAPLGSWAVAMVVRPEREALADATGVAMTRYPPGLLAALEKIEADGAGFRPPSRTIDHLWLQLPETVGMERPPFEERIEALREL